VARERTITVKVQISDEARDAYGSEKSVVDMLTGRLAGDATAILTDEVTKYRMSEVKRIQALLDDSVGNAVEA